MNLEELYDLRAKLTRIANLPLADAAIALNALRISLNEKLLAIHRAAAAGAL